MRIDWIIGGYVLSGPVAVVATVLFLVWRQNKPAAVRILHTVAVFVLPAFLLFDLAYRLSWWNLTMRHKQIKYMLEACLDNMNIPDAKLAAAWETDDLQKVEQNLYRLLPKPSATSDGRAEERHDEIASDPLERKPADRFFHTFPRSAGAADYAGTPGFAARIQELETRLGESYWNGRGVIVTGQLRVEGAAVPTGVASRTKYFKNGVFAALLHPDDRRELQFFKSGYEPLAIWLAPPFGAHPKRIDLGVIEMNKTPRPSAVTLSVKLPENLPSAKLRLRTGWPAPTWRDWAHECGAPIHATVVEREVKPGEKIRLEGLSDIPYELKLSAPGAVGRTFYFNGFADRDLGAIALAPARKQTFRLKPAGGTEWKNVTLELDGDTELVVAPKDEFGNTVALRLAPDRGSDRILADFPWRPVYFDDYGKTAPETSPLPRPVKYEGTFFLVPGHLYRVRNASTKTDTLVYLEPAAETH